MSLMQLSEGGIEVVTLIEEGREKALEELKKLLAEEAALWLTIEEEEAPLD